MQIKTILFLLGDLLILIGILMMIPIGIALIYQEAQAVVFLATGGLALLTGTIFCFLFKKSKGEPLKTKDGFVLVTLSWIALSVLGAIPFLIAGTFNNPADALFESVSGFTTTGSSVLVNVEAQPRSILFWRSFTHWIGGIGIIVLALAILPYLSLGGMQLFKAEFSGPVAERLRPRITSTAKRFLGIYIGLSIIIALALQLAGMPWFDSICHMFGAIGTGGFSIKNQSIAAYHNPLIEIIIALAMFISGTNFVLHYNFINGDFKSYFKNSEFKQYFIFITGAILVVGACILGNNYFSIGESFRKAMFQVISLGTATGYSTADFDTWPSLAKGILFLLMFAGGCAGSTAGGMKQIRILILLKKIKQAVQKNIYPSLIKPIKLAEGVLPDDIVDGIISFSIIYIITFVILTLIMLSFNLDLITASSSVIATMSNVGPGFNLVGPARNFASLPSLAKYVLCFSMLIGRLEVLTVLILFFPLTWKK